MSRKYLIKCYFIVFIASTFSEGLSDTTSSSELCVDCVENVVMSRCNIPFCPATSSCDNTIDLKTRKEVIDEPSLVCRDENSLTFTWNRTERTYYFIEYFKPESNESKFTEFTQCNFITINELSADQKYYIYLYAFSLHRREVFVSGKLLAKTSDLKEKRSPVKNLNYTFTLTDRQNSYTATVKWTPGTDLSCLYEIMWYNHNIKKELGEYIHRKVNLKKQIKSEFNIMNLEFGKKYHFSIMSVDKAGSMESTKTRLNIAVPSCLETFRNVSLCRPEKPKNLQAIEYVESQNENVTAKIGQCNLNVSWTIPEIQPDYYIILFESFQGVPQFSFKRELNISGEQNVAYLKNVEIGSYYIVKLTAYSKAGASKPSYFRHHIQDIDNNTSTASNKTVVIPNLTEITHYFGNVSLWIWSGVIIVLCLTVTFVFRRRLKKLLFEYLFIKERIDETIIVRYAISETEDTKWELAESKLLTDKVIGFGAFGIVQKGYYYLEHDNKMEVAVKTLKANPTGEQITQFYDEIEIMKSVPRHAHIVYLIGVVTKHRPSNPLMLVEYCARGDLQSFLRKVAFVLEDSDANGMRINTLEYPQDGTKFFNKSYDLETSIMKDTYILESKDLLSFARQIVLGMEFLSNLKVIHRDLAARNVLISENNTVKISDFGLSRDIYTENIYKKVTGGKLPFRWMALESLTHQVYTTESDVWSFGIVLWEIVTLGENPYPTVNTEDLVPLLKSGYRMNKPINCSDELYQIMLDCWQTSPNLRSSFRELRDVFDKLLESEMQYISLEDAHNIELNNYENINSETESCVEERYIVQGSMSY